MALLPAFAAVPAFGAEPQLLIEESTVYYPVYGRDRQELMRSLRVPDSGHLAHTAHGLTRSDFQVESEFVQDNARCIVRKLTMRIDLPRWDDASPIPPGLRDDWKQISERTARHEDLHRRNALDAVNELRRALRLRPPDAACADLSKALRRETNRVRSRWQLRDNLLDQRDVLILPAERARRR
jgi:predicted secreted Zn-dependent protease